MPEGDTIFPTSVGATTSAPSLADQVKKYKGRTLQEKAADDTVLGPAHESLVTKCIKTIVENFKDSPQMLEEVPPQYLPQVTSKLSLDLPVQVTGPYICDENYWKRSCMKKLGWGNCQIEQHGLTWKQLYFEKDLQERLENYDPQKETLEAILEKVSAAQDNVFSLHISQLLSHIDIDQVTKVLPNLTKLDLTYGVKQIGMKYERMLFGMKISDATSIAKAIKDSETLTTLILSSNLLDDDLLRMLMTGLIKTNSITYLDVSHNKITNHGARLLSKLLGSKSVLTSLNVCDNQIHAEGGRYLGRGLRHNESLTDLNLRLNRLTDEGGRMLFDGLRDNMTLTTINLSSNSIGAESVQSLASLLREPICPLCCLDLSSNDLEEADINVLQNAITNNTKIISLDLRMNEEVPETSEAMVQIQEIVRTNELNNR